MRSRRAFKWRTDNPVTGSRQSGAIEAKGKLPVSINDSFQVNEGLSTIKMNRLGFTTPENVAMSSEKLAQIETIAQKAIREKMAPGIQVLVARKGKVIYQKAFGNYTYDSDTKVTNETIFDIASVSKIVGTLPNVMQQYDQQKNFLVGAEYLF